MKIRSVEVLKADAGYRALCFVKIATDEGITGWAEYAEAQGNPGTAALIAWMGQALVGADPRETGKALSRLELMTHTAPDGIAGHARGAIANALLDIAGKAAGLPVHALFGGKIRDRVPVYWSHFGNGRMQSSEFLGTPRLTRYEELTELAREAEARGFSGVKMNIFLHDGERFVIQSPGHGQGPGFPELNPDRAMMNAIEKQFEAVRRGSESIGLMVDLNLNFKREGYAQMLHRLEPWDIVWAELDVFDAGTVAALNAGTATPLAGGEVLTGRRAYQPFIDAYAYDTLIVDVLWNGFPESYRIAAAAETRETNIAPHNFYGALGDQISGMLAAVVPNLRQMEFEPDDVPWRNDFFSHPTVIENGQMLISDRPGWGVDVIEEAVRARPWPRR